MTEDLAPKKRDQEAIYTALETVLKAAEARGLDPKTAQAILEATRKAARKGSAQPKQPGRVRRQL